MKTKYNKKWQLMTATCADSSCCLMSHTGDKERLKRWELFQGDA